MKVRGDATHLTPRTGPPREPIPPCPTIRVRSQQGVPALVSWKKVEYYYLTIYERTFFNDINKLLNTRARVLVLLPYYNVVAFPPK